MTTEQQRIVDLVIARAEQACRYALVRQEFEREAPDRKSEYESGWIIAAETCEYAIRGHVVHHIAKDIADG